MLPKTRFSSDNFLLCRLFFIALFFPVFLFSQPDNHTVFYYKDVKINLNERLNDSSYFEVSIDSSQTFSSPLELFSQSAEIIVTGLQANKRYYFRYRSLNFYNDTSSWSGIYDFTTFDPLELNPSLWLAPDSSVIVDANNYVLSWLDKSGNSNNLTQSSALAPLFNPDTTCTTPSLYFNGSATSLVGNAIPNIDNSSLTLVGLASGLPVASTVEQGFFTINNWTNGIWLERGTSTESFVNWSNGDFLRNPMDMPNAGFDFKLLGYRKRLGQDVSLYINEVNTATSASGALTGAFTNSSFSVGGHSLGNWKGNIGEILLFANALSDSNLNLCNEYLKTKYFPKLELGEDLYVCSYPQVVRVCNDYFTSYLWSDSNITDSIVINSAGIYYLTANDIFGRSFSDTIVVTDQSINPPASLFTSDTLKFCDGNVVSLYAGPRDFIYAWSGGEITNKILIDETGWYAVTISNCIGNSIDDSIYVSFEGLPTFSLGTDTLVCYPNSLVLAGDSAMASWQYQWSTGGSTSSITTNENGTYWLRVSNPLGCTFSDTISVSFDTTLSNVSLGPDMSLCAGNIITLVSGNGSGLSYLWNDSSTNDSISVLTSGQYWINVTNANNCVTKDTINVTIAGQAPVAAFENSLACVNSPVNFSDTSIALGGNTITNWFWNFGDPNSTADTAIISQPVYTFTDTGSYSISLTVTTNAGCSQSIIKNVEVYPSPTALLGADTTLCGGNIITFVSISGTGLTYLWNDNSTNDSIVVNASGQYDVVVTNSDNCVAKDSINIIVPGFAPGASFTNSLTCENNAVVFTDGSTPPAGDTINSWNWDFGDPLTPDDTSFLQNTFYTYADTGNYLVSLTVETNVGCTHTFTKNIHIAPTPIVNFSNVIACQNDSAVFVNSSTSQNYTPLAYQWNFGDTGSGTNNVSTLTNPAHIFSQQIVYPVKLVVTNNAGCKDSLTKNITVKAEVSADFTYSSPCTNAPVLFQDNSIAPTPNSSNTRTWVIGASTFNGLSLSYSFSTSGTYPVKLTVNGFNGCSSSIIKNVSVKLPPVAQFALNAGCLNDTLKPIDQSVPQDSVLTSWNWQLNNVSFSTGQTATVVPSISGSHTVELVVTNAFGCKDSISKTVSVFALPTVDFTTNPTDHYFVDSSITFIPNVTNGTLYNWIIDNSTYSGQTVSHIFDTIGTQAVTLYMEDNNDCGNTKTNNLLIQNYMIDLAVLAVRAVVGSDDYITVEADIANFGTAPVYGFEISYHITDASSIKESWSGTPNTSSYFTYVFTSKVKQLVHNPDYITCVTIESVNSRSDSDPDNNKRCITSDLSSTYVFDPFPNPTKENLTLPVVLTKESQISFEVIDLLGQIIGKTEVIEGVPGLNMLNIRAEQLNPGQYFLQIFIDDKPFIKRFTKINPD